MKMNKHKLTREFCLQNKLLFNPRTEAESVTIQKKLHAFGFPWVNSGQAVLTGVDEVFKGIVVKEGRLFTRSETDNADYLFCTLEQFDAGYEEPLLTREEQLSLLQKFDALTRLFTDLSAKVDAISGKIDAVHDQVMPTTLSKTRLKSDGDNHAP